MKKWKKIITCAPISPIQINDYKQKKFQKTFFFNGRNYEHGCFLIIVLLPQFPKFSDYSLFLSSWCSRNINLLNKNKVVISAIKFLGKSSRLNAFISPEYKIFKSKIIWTNCRLLLLNFSLYNTPLNKNHPRKYFNM